MSQHPYLLLKAPGRAFNIIPGMMGFSEDADERACCAVLEYNCCCAAVIYCPQLIEDIWKDIRIWRNRNQHRQNSQPKKNSAANRTAVQRGWPNARAGIYLNGSGAESLPVDTLTEPPFNVNTGTWAQPEVQAEEDMHHATPPFTRSDAIRSDGTAHDDALEPAQGHITVLRRPPASSIMQEDGSSDIFGGDWGPDDQRRTPMRQSASASDT